MFVLDVPENKDGDTIGIRDAIAMVIEQAELGVVRFVAMLPGKRMTKRIGNRAVFVGDCGYNPCDYDYVGKCADGEACPKCAHTLVLARLADYEAAIAALAEVMINAKGRWE